MLTSVSVTGSDVWPVQTWAINQSNSYLWWPTVPLIFYMPYKMWHANVISIRMTSSNGNLFRVTGHLCGEIPGHGEFPTQRPVTRSFDVSFDLRINKWLSKQWWSWWFETPSRPLWRHSNAGRIIRPVLLRPTIYFAKLKAQNVPLQSRFWLSSIVSVTSLYPLWMKSFRGLSNITVWYSDYDQCNLHKHKR